MTMTDQALARADAGFEASIARWIDWLRIPSVSAQPTHDADSTPLGRAFGGFEEDREVGDAFSRSLKIFLCEVIGKDGTNPGTK